MTQSAQTIGLALIAKDEAGNLPHLLASIEGGFDQIVLLDTGSTDRTLEVFADWAEREQPPLGCVIDRFDWCDDFAAARNAADALLETDWECFADCDDEIHGAEHLRSIAGNAPADCAELRAVYGTAPEAAESLIAAGCWPWAVKERLHRRGTAEWTGRCYEFKHLKVPATIHRISDHLVQWVHRRSPTDQRSTSRDVPICREWIRSQPGNPLPYFELARRERQRGHHADSRRLLEECEQLLALREDWPPPHPDAAALVLRAAHLAVQRARNVTQEQDVAQVVSFGPDPPADRPQGSAKSRRNRRRLSSR